MQIQLLRRQLIKHAGLSALVLALSPLEKALSAEQRKKWVMLDPGHGMGNKKENVFDPGCCYAGYREADLNLQLALRTGDFLVKENIESGYTRATNEEETHIDRRWQIANSSYAPLFISFHCDASKNRKDEKTRGIKVYHFPTSDKARQLAELVYNSLTAELRNNKVDFIEQGVRPSTEYRLLRLTKMPAILIEAGYLSNTQDRAYLTEKRDVLARAIAVGISSYVRAN